jgi:hypothetical protein
MIGIMTAWQRRIAWQLIREPSIVSICEPAVSPLQMILPESGNVQLSDGQTIFRADLALAQWDVTTLPERYIN